MFKYNNHISVNSEMKIFVASKLFHNQSDNYSAYNPETGEEITWAKIRKHAQDYFYAQKTVKLNPKSPKPEISKPKDITELLKSGAVQIGNNSKLQERLNKIQKPETAIIEPPDSQEPKATVIHKPEGNTQTVTHK